MKINESIIIMIPFWRIKEINNLTVNIKDKVFTEKWKYIEGTDKKYMVSSFGRVKSLPRWHNGHKTFILSQSLNSDGYPSCRIFYNKKRKYKTVHRILMTSFFKNKNNFPQINHEDGDKTNNFFKNLTWCSAYYNVNHAIKNGLLNVKGENSSKTNLKNKDVLDIFNSNLPTNKLSEKYKLSNPVILSIKRGTSWKSVTNMEYKRIQLDKKSVLEIFNSKEDRKCLSERYAVHEKTIDRIKMGRIWSEITNKKHHPKKRKFLSFENVIFIYNSNLKQKELAEMFNVNQVTISDIKRGITWQKEILKWKKSLD